VATGSNKDLELDVNNPMAVFAYAVDYSEDITT
jgi:hypothetical protein